MPLIFLYSYVTIYRIHNEDKKKEKKGCASYSFSSLHFLEFTFKCPLQWKNGRPHDYGTELRNTPPPPLPCRPRRTCSSSKAAIRRQPTDFRLFSVSSQSHPFLHDVQPFHEFSLLYFTLSSSKRGRLNQDEACPSTTSLIDSFRHELRQTLRLFASSILEMCCIEFAHTPEDTLKSRR